MVLVIADEGIEEAMEAMEEIMWELMRVEHLVGVGGEVVDRTIHGDGGDYVGVDGDVVLDTQSSIWFRRRPEEMKSESWK